MTVSDDPTFAQRASGHQRARHEAPGTGVHFFLPADNSAESASLAAEAGRSRIEECGKEGILNYFSWYL